MKFITLFGLLFVLGIVLHSCKHEAPTPVVLQNNTSVAGNVSFQKDVLPILQTSCASTGGCHNAVSKADGYQLTSYATTMQKGIKPGDAAGSKVYQAIIETDPMELMPPGAPLLPAQKEIIKQWIDQGAKDN